MFDSPPNSLITGDPPKGRETLTLIPLPSDPMPDSPDLLPDHGLGYYQHLVIKKTRKM